MATSKTQLKKRPKAPTPDSPTQAIAIRVDAALARAWKARLAILESAGREGMRAWDRKYEAVGEILEHEPPLYLAGGISTDRDFVAKHLPGEDHRSVLRSVRVAQYASPDEESRYGTSKLDAAIAYLEAKHGKPQRGRLPVDFERLRIDTGDGSVLFKDATVDQVRSAARRASRSGKSAPAGKRHPWVVALTSKLPKGAKDVAVHYAKGRISLGGIPVAQLSAVLRALSAVKAPAE